LPAKKERIGLRVGAYDLHVHFVHAWLYPQKLVTGFLRLRLSTSLKKFKKITNQISGSTGKKYKVRKGNE
jgi:hypothetical protein